MAYEKKQGSCPCIAVNSHNNTWLSCVVQTEQSCSSVPNVGKSVIVNAIHQIGRIGAAGNVYRFVTAALLYRLGELGSGGIWPLTSIN
ncbi:unnamed protein product [Urochloa humidicola]